MAENTRGGCDEDVGMWTHALQESESKGSTSRGLYYEEMLLCSSLGKQSKEGASVSCQTS